MQWGIPEAGSWRIPEAYLNMETEAGSCNGGYLNMETGGYLKLEAGGSPVAAWDRVQAWELTSWKTTL